MCFTVPVGEVSSLNHTQTTAYIIVRKEEIIIKVGSEYSAASLGFQTEPVDSIDESVEHSSGGTAVIGAQWDQLMPFGFLTPHPLYPRSTTICLATASYTIITPVSKCSKIKGPEGRFSGGIVLWYQMGKRDHLPLRSWCNYNTVTIITTSKHRPLPPSVCHRCSPKAAALY